MPREQRVELLRKIQDIRESHVITYVTGDRQLIPARIAEDTVRPMYEYLLLLDKTEPRRERIDVFLFSRGGDVSVPWRIVSMLREFCKELNVLVPYKAHSAATMIALGADRIVMGRKAELSPIDPTLVRTPSGESAMPPEEISVEDVSSYISFVRERAHITDQSALATMVGMLADRLSPLTLGSVNRQHSHIRLVARKLLSSHVQKMEEERVSATVEALTEKMYSHGHAIGRKEASELRLAVELAEPELENLMWQLYEQYEALLRLKEPLDIEAAFEGQDADELVLKNECIACIETVLRLDAFRQNVRLLRRRNIPQNLQINLNVGLPPGIDPQTLPQQAQQLLQQFAQQVLQIVEQAVREQIRRQLPVTGMGLRTFGGAWRDSTNDGI